MRGVSTSLSCPPPEEELGQAIHQANKTKEKPKLPRKSIGLVTHQASKLFFHITDRYLNEMHKRKQSKKRKHDNAAFEADKREVRGMGSLDGFYH